MDIYFSIVLYLALFFGLYYQIFILVTFFEKEENNLNEKEAYEPTVTIIVPCFNEANTLEKTVLSLLNLNYPKEKLFITIIDDGSTDSTYMKALGLTKYKNVEAFTQENGGKFTALNFGIRSAQTEIVGCLDADSIVNPDALKKMLPCFKKEKVVSVIPSIKTLGSVTILQKIQCVEYNLGIFTKKILSRLDALHVTPGPFSLFRKEMFDEIGYFKHAHNTEDMEIACRIQSNHYRIAYCSDALVYTKTPSTFMKLHKQRTRWTYGFLKNIMDYKHMFFNARYGNVGTLTLPFAIILSVISCLMFANAIYSSILYAIEHTKKYMLVGFSFDFFSFDMFFFNTGATALLIAVVLLCGLVLIGMAWKFVEGKVSINRDMVYFIVIYGFIAPLWLARATINVVISKKVSWR